MPSDESVSNNPLFRQGRRIVDRSGRDILELAEEAGFMVCKVAETLGITVRQFEGALERSVGIRPKELFRNHRALVARQMILEGGDLKKISARLGFRHYSHFASEIKGFYGVPPVQLQTIVRNRNRGK